MVACYIVMVWNVLLGYGVLWDGLDKLLRKEVYEENVTSLEPRRR